MRRRYIAFPLILILAICLNFSGCQSVFSCLISNCQFCTSGTNCGRCNKGYILTVVTFGGSTSCLEITCNVTNCSYCLTANMCESCLNGLVPNVAGQCTTSTNKNFLCPSPLSNYCLICSNVTGQPSCTRCIAGYVLLQNKSCVPPSSANPLCQLTVLNISNVSPTLCGLCYSPTQTLGLSPTYNCQPYNPTLVCPTGCQQCTSNTTCIYCQYGYILNIGTQQCIKSTVTYCTQYSTTNSSLCKSCLAGFTVVNNNCILAVFGCTVQNCLVCNGTFACYICKTGYVPYSTGQYVECLTPQQINQLSSPLLMVQNCQSYTTNNYISDSIIQLPPKNRIQYGPLCMQCSPGMVLISGICLPQNSANFNCTVFSCISCIANNYCGQCQRNSKLIDGICVYFNNIFQGCVATGYNSAGALVCLLCQKTYINANSNCIPMYTLNCTIPGCMYCTQNNSCTECINGWQLQLNTTTQISTCISTCNNITNCYSCTTKSPIECLMCNLGYVLDELTGGCISAEIVCPKYYGVGCLDCNYQHGCVKCGVGYVLENGLCCAGGQAANITGCMLQSACSAICLECYPGYIRTNQGQCFSFHCNITNCLYCTGNSTCTVCQTGYALDAQQNVCINNFASLSCRTAQNPYCTSCTGSTCQTCDYYTTLIGGQCYCNIPGCLRCLGNKVCTECVYPLVPNVADGGCILRPQLNSICLVANCVYCSIQPTMCSICADGYSLNSQNQCSLNKCTSILNCVLCNKLQTTCYSCKSSYAISTINGNNCVPITKSYYCNILNCALCSTEDQNHCLQCIQMYTLTSPTVCTRVTCPSNCVYCLNQRSCLVCDETTYLSSNFVCETKEIIPWFICGQANCLQCNNNQQCKICMPGYQPNNQGYCIKQDCTASNCRVCLPTASLGLCMICQQGYFLNSYQQCIQYSPAPLVPSCSAQNCLYCYKDNMCSVCFPGYEIQQGLCVLKSGCLDDKCEFCLSPNVCAICRGGFSLSNGYCTNTSLILGITIPILVIVLGVIAYCLYKRIKKRKQLALTEKTQFGDTSQSNPNYNSVDVQIQDSPLPHKETVNAYDQSLLTSKQGQI